MDKSLYQRACKLVLLFCLEHGKRELHGVFTKIRSGDKLVRGALCLCRSTQRCKIGAAQRERARLPSLRRRESPQIRERFLERAAPLKQRTELIIRFVRVWV